MDPTLPARGLPNTGRWSLRLAPRRDNTVDDLPHRPPASVADFLSVSQAALERWDDRGRTLASPCAPYISPDYPRLQNTDCPFPSRISHPFQMEVARPQRQVALAAQTRQLAPPSPARVEGRGRAWSAYRGSMMVMRTRAVLAWGEMARVSAANCHSEASHRPQYPKPHPTPHS